MAGNWGQVQSGNLGKASFKKFIDLRITVPLFMCDVARLPRQKIFCVGLGDIMSN